MAYILICDCCNKRVYPSGCNGMTISKRTVFRSQVNEYHLCDDCLEKVEIYFQALRDSYKETRKDLK